MPFLLWSIAKVIIAAVVAIVAIVGGYLIYLHVSSARLPDREELHVAYVSADNASPPLREGDAYRALTYNIGFGAYDHAFSFFMSEAKTVEGDEVRGLMSRAASEEAVRSNVAAAAAAVVERDPDISLFQEVDVSAGRSYKVDELILIGSALTENSKAHDGAYLASVYAANFHTGWLFWPPARPMGRVRDSGIATYSSYGINSAERRSLPVDESFIGSLFDLDRCFSVARLPVEGADAELVLINVHLSAYDAGEKMRGEQMEKLVDFMREERENGNWVITGGDWNQCFPGSLDAFTGRMEVPDWAKSFDESALPEGFSLVVADNADVIATCRDTSMPWTPGVSYETILDGWVVSDNVAASAENIDTDYAASDHNPVLLTFTLL